MIKGSKSSGRGSRSNLESQNDEAYLTGRRSAQESEKQIRTPLKRGSGAGGRAPGIKPGIKK